MLHIDGFSLLVGLVLFDDTKVLQSCPESTCPQSRRLSVSNDVFIVLIYILYILTIIFYFVHWCSHAQPLARESAHRSARALREGGSAHRSAHAPRQASLRPP